MRRSGIWAEILLPLVTNSTEETICFRVRLWMQILKSSASFAIVFGTQCKTTIRIAKLCRACTYQKQKQANPYPGRAGSFTAADVTSHSLYVSRPICQAEMWLRCKTALDWASQVGLEFISHTTFSKIHTNSPSPSTTNHQATKWRPHELPTAAATRELMFPYYVSLFV